MEQLRVVEVDDASATRSAMEKAGRLLAARPRTEHELRVRLGAAGFEHGVVETTVNRLRELQLVDDAAFARQWVEERSRTKAVGRNVLEDELRAKGVDRDLVAHALAELESDEEELAQKAASRYIKRVLRHPLREQYRRLVDHLIRKGFEPEVAGAGARSVLPPEGWD